MSKKNLLLGTLPALAIAAGIFVTTSQPGDSNYAPRNSSHLDKDETTINGAFEYYHRLKGDYTTAQWERAKSLAYGIQQDRSSYGWIDLGPDNIGGRTRAIIIDRNNINHLYAGSVSGGLFESINRGGTWSKVESFTENLAISSMCQTADGTIYVATGHDAEDIQGTFESGAFGYGIYKSNPDGSWDRIPGTEEYNYINEIIADNDDNFIWIASSHGLKKYIAASEELQNITTFSSAGACKSLSVSNDGKYIIGHAPSGGPSRVLLSTDSGETFSEISAISEDPGIINMTGVSRIEFAFSHEKIDGEYRIYASTCGSNGLLQGVWRSANTGNSWARIAPAYDGTPGGFGPFAITADQGQGNYDQVITVVPGSPDRIYLGGIDCYTWSTTGNWEQVSQFFLSPTNPKYVHADNHEMVWDEWGRLYIGNDGGVAFSENANTAEPEFHPANRGYNVTQFFAIGVSSDGYVIGGAQDNGTSSNYHDGTTWQEHDEMNDIYFGGDGFSADISFINDNLIFASVYNASVRRSSDRGENGQYYTPDGLSCTPGAFSGGGCGQFFTKFELWENPNDTEATDSVRFIASQSYSAGDSIQVPSATSQTMIEMTTPIDLLFQDTLISNPDLTYDDILVVDEISGTDYNLGVVDWDFVFGGDEVSEGDTLVIYGVDENDTIVVESTDTQNHFVGTNDLRPGVEIDMGSDSIIYDVSWDSLIVQDKLQSWFALEIGGTDGLFMTRNALRFSAPEDGWFSITDQITEDIMCMEFSKNGDYLFIGTESGRIFRISGFNDVYSPTGIANDPVFEGSARIDTLYDWKGDAFPVRSEVIHTFPASRAVTSIASGSVDDPDHLVVTLGQFGAFDKVYESNNATGASPDFTSLNFPSTGEGPEASGIPCYASLIDRDNPNTILIGTEFGVFATEDGGDNWENVSGDFGTVAIHDIEQNWRTWDEGCKRPGEIYIGTHGRGIWSTDALLSTPSQSDQLDPAHFQPNINVYPNPLNSNGTVEFYLPENGDVTLQVFNLSGQLVRQIISNNREAGQNQLVFDADQLQKGTYILRISSQNMMETTKFIKH